MSARDVIAKTLRDAAGSGESCEMKARYISQALTAAGYTILGPDEIHAPSVERADAFEEVAKWHDKNARFCLEASKDDPRLNADDRKRAFEAHKHHAASAAAIRNKMSDERRAALRELMKEKGHG